MIFVKDTSKSINAEKASTFLESKNDLRYGFYHCDLVFSFTQNTRAVRKGFDASYESILYRVSVLLSLVSVQIVHW